MSDPIRPFRERYEAALADRELGRRLLNFQRAWGDARQAAFTHFATKGPLGVASPDFEAQRAQLTAAKSQTPADREAQLERFCRAAEAAGARVHRTSTAEEAVRA